MTSQQNENAVNTTTKIAPRRKSSILAALTLNCNLPTIPIINEPPGVAVTEMSTTATTSTSASDVKKKSLRFDTNTLTTHEYDSEEVKETKRRITDEIMSVCKLSDKNRANDRLSRPRMSLLGKPLNYNRGARRDARYRRLQSRVYNFLERPRGVPAILYHMMVFVIVFTCLVLSVFSTIDIYEAKAMELLMIMEIIVVIWFSVEFGLRLWSSGCRSRYQGAIGRLKFLKRPFCIVDIITIAASLVVLGMGTSIGIGASALRGLRFFQILRMVRMDRRGGTWKLLGSVVYAHRQELITTLYIGFLGLIFASFLMYLVEREQPGTKFTNFAQALWWGVITLCTGTTLIKYFLHDTYRVHNNLVGYGDAVPETWQGKIIASFCALLGISFFALPAGILGSGFALKVQQQQRQKHMIRRRQPAATLIQSLWRCYAADEHSLSEATWKIHQVPLPSPPPSSKLEVPDKTTPATAAINGFTSKSLIRRASSSFKHNASFVARLPTIRRHKSQSLHSPGNLKPSGGSQRGRNCPRTNEINNSAENLDVANNGKPMNASLSEDSVAETALAKKNSDEDDAVRRFPKQPTEFKSTNVKLTVKNTRQTTMTIANHEDEEPRCVQLTNQHKAAIRFIRKLKYFVARKKFREALKPYDVKDVMEQYTAGHADLLTRVRNLQFRLDQILGKQGSKAKDVYASKISLASRVVKIERQVDDVETKLDNLIELYMQDRKRLLSLPIGPEPSHSNNLPQLPPNPPSGSAPIVISSMAVSNSSANGASSSGSLKPKPILVDKQSSEPNSPIAKSFEESQQQNLNQKRPPMHRGFSDLGNRMKKRVTMSSSIPTQYSSHLENDCSGNSGDVVIVVPSLDNLPEHVRPDIHSHHICIDPEGEVEPNSPKTITESSMALLNEEDDEEDLDEEDLDIGTEIDPDSPPWDLYGEQDIDDNDDSNEDTALLRSKAARIVITPISPVSSSHDIARMEGSASGHDAGRSGNNGTRMDLLKPDMQPQRIFTEDI